MLGLGLACYLAPTSDKSPLVQMGYTGLREKETAPLCILEELLLLKSCVCSVVLYFSERVLDRWKSDS